MPAIAPIEDLRTAQKEGLSIYAMRYALCLPAVGTALCGLLVMAPRKHS